MRQYFAIMVLSLVTACSSAPQMHSYQLSDSAPSQATMKADQPVLYVAPIQMTPLISGMGLVYQVSDIEVVQAQRNVWAQDIAQQIRHKITADLRTKQQDYWVQNSELSDNRLSIRLDKFQAVYTGNAVLSGEWTLTEQGKATAHQAFNIEVPLSEEGGYQAQVVALSQGVSELAQQIVDVF